MCAQESVYEVEKFVSIKREGPRKRNLCGIKVFIKWKDYSHDENTWEPVENLNRGAAIGMMRDFVSEVQDDRKKIKLIEEAIHWLKMRNELEEEREAKAQMSKPRGRPSRAKSQSSESFKANSPTLQRENFGRQISQSRQPSIQENSSLLSHAAENVMDPKSSVGQRNSSLEVRNSSHETRLFPTTQSYQPVQRTAAISEEVRVRNSSDQLYTISYTKIQKQNQGLNNYTVTRAKISKEDNRIIDIEVLDLAEEFSKIEFKDELFKLCLNQWRQSEQNFQNLGQKIVNSSSIIRNKNIPL